MASKMSSPKVEGRTMAWDSLKITIPWAADKPPVSLDECELIKPIAMQFALLSKSRRETLLHKLRDKRIELSERNISNGHLELTVTTQLKGEDEVKNHVVGALIESLKDIEWFEIDKKTNDYHPVRSEISKVSGSADSERLILFDGKNSMYVVGESTDIKRCKEQMKVEQRLLTKYKWANLKKLKIEEYFKSKNIKVMVIETGNAVKVRGSFCEAEKASKEINLFCDKICKMPVNFVRKDLDLLFLENGDLNFAVLDLFRKSLEEKHVKSFIEIDEADHLLYICSLDEKELRRSKEVINGCINTHTVAIPMYNAIKPLLEEYKNKMKVFIGDKSVKLVCTNDVPFTELIDPEDIPLPQIVIEFLAGYGRENLNMIENTNGVIVTIDEENSVFRINGKNENRKKFKKHLKKSNCIDTFPLEVCSSLVKKHEDELQKIANSHQCCLQARYLNDNAFLSKDSKKVANWKHVRSFPNVSLIVGQIKALETDYKVLFVTDKLCPLHKCDPSSDEYENNIPVEQLEKMEKGTINLGEVIDYGQKEKRCQTKAIVIAKANGGDAFHCKKLKQPIQKIFTEVIDMKAKSIAIQISLYYENLSMEELVEFCLSEILSHHAELEVYLVCHPSEDVNEVAQTIDKIYQKEGPGYYRENHTQDISFKNSFHKIKTEVKIESLVEMKADVIVNTIGIDLDFEKGYLSKHIYSKAGESIVEECRIKYPSGIEPGSLAVTGPGLLRKKRVKNIFHCALQLFKKSTFETDVKEMVRRCLLEMEMRKLKTVAFPAFGTGRLGYPKRETAKAMFDAVEEYQYSCIKSSVESVVFALYVGDIDTCDIFCDEEKRRKQKKQEKKYIAGEKSNFPELHTTIGQKEWQVRLTVASEEDLKQLTSNVVLAEFKCVKEGGDCELKYSSKSPETKNDILKVFVANKEEAKDTELSDAIGKLMKYCKENKIAELVIPTNNGVTLPAEKQIDIIVKKVEEHAKSKGTEHLNHVYVSLPSSESLDDVERHLKCRGTESFFSSLKGYFYSTLVWSRNTSNLTPVEINIIGCSTELVEQTKMELKEYTCRLHDQNKKDDDGGKTDKTKITKKQSGNNGYECIIGGDECIINEEKCIINEDDSVTAELNPGIVSYLKGQQTFDTWRKKIMDLHKVSCRKRAGGIEVCGSFSSILSLETYLDDYFSQDEGQDERKDGLQEKDEDSTLQNDEEKKNQDKWQDEDKDIWQGKEQVKLQEPTYTLAGMDIILTEIKLTDLEVDCIVVPINERLEIVGFDDVEQLAGNEYKEACKENLSAYGKVLSSECRMTDAGKLLCSKVLHFVEPSWHEDIWSQSVLQDSIGKCLETADKATFSTIAIPVIYSGKKMFSKLGGQAYVEAFSAFSKYRKHISKVFISVQDKSKQDVLMKALIDDVEREKEAKGLATRTVETSFSIDYPCKNGLVRICSKIGEVHADNVCAVVSEAVDIPSTGESNIGNKNNRKNSASLRSKKSSVGSVNERKVEEVNLNYRYVLQTIIPRRNKKYTQSTGKFEDDIKQTVVNVLNKATNLECRSVALPLMGRSEDPLIPTPLETCCSAMLKGITTFLSNSKSHLVQIDIVDTSTDVARKLRNELQKIKPKEGIV